jgi:hypothetical protein
MQVKTEQSWPWSITTQFPSKYIGLAGTTLPLFMPERPILMRQRSQALVAALDFLIENLAVPNTSEIPAETGGANWQTTAVADFQLRRSVALVLCRRPPV